jgi:opacity protein-like surface antigen
MQRLATAWLCLLGLLTVSNVALAQHDDYARQGFYAGALGLGAIETFDVSGFDSSDGGGFNIRAGYRVHERIALEAQFEYVTGFGDLGVDIEAWNLMGSVKGFLLTDGFQPYALFGLGVIEAEASAGGLSVDETDFAIRIGGGFDAYLNENWLLFVESAWVKPTDELEDFSYVTVGAGIQFRF